MQKVAVLLVCVLLVSAVLAASTVVFAGKPPDKGKPQPGTEYRISDEPEPVHHLAIDGNIIVWSAGPSYSYLRIWMHDLGPDGVPFTADDGKRKEVSTSEVEIDFIRMHDGRAVFRKWDDDGGIRVYMMDLTVTPEIQYLVSYSTFGNHWPDIYGNIVVYESFPGGGSEEGTLNFHNIGSDGIPGTDDDVIYQMPSPEPSCCAGPRIWGNRVVCRGGWIYTLDENGAPDDGEQLPVPVGGVMAIHEDVVAYVDDRSGSWDVYVYDLLTDEETAIATGRKDEIWPEIHGAWVAYCENEEGVKKGRFWRKSDVFAHDLVDGETFELTNSTDGWCPDVFGNSVAYKDTRDDNADVYLFVFDSNGGGQSAGVRPGTDGFSLLQNTPNPVRDRTTIRFTLAESTPVTVTIHDVAGRAVATVADGQFTSGSHAIEWTPDVPSGTYFCRLSADDYSASRRMTMIR